MSIEYLGTPKPPLNLATIAKLLDQLAHASGLRTVRKTDLELGLANIITGKTTHETTTISLATDEVYLGFHSEVRDERERILAMIHKLLREQGIGCDLEEQ